MDKIRCVVSGVWLLCVLVSATATAQTSLSIYSDGRVVVRKTLPQPLQKGTNALTLRLDNLDPATLFSPDSSVTVVSVVTRLPTDRGAALQRAVGQTLSFVRARGDTVRATVVSVNPPQYKLTDGRVLLSEPGEPLFPAEQIRGATEASIVLDATRGRTRTDLAYVTSGATWEAAYQAVLGKTALPCVFLVAALSLPALVAIFIALRSLAPTRLTAAGAAAGTLAGGLGAAVYALHCNEMTLPFVAVWYVLGMAIPGALGALLGRRWLHWS